MGALVLNTRPESDSADLLTALETRGFEHLSAPMLEIAFADFPRTFDANLYQGIVFTSANGVRAFARMTKDRSLPAFCVGDATAKMATVAGFASVHSANGNVQDLAALIAEKCDPIQGALFHPAARKTAGDLGIMLDEHGFQIDRQTVYEAKPVDTLTDTVIEAIRNHRVDAVLFFSPRTAESFVKVVQRYKLEGEFSTAHAICLSNAVQSPISVLTWQATHIASQPTQEYLLSMLESVMS
ncbi:uroporphyrinogen-III synthase [Thalassospira sp. MA62]|nr:uroporphyrinogen-III synthase [Thalassospira sp. MA62]